jgi:hypothetical protein
MQGQFTHYSQRLKYNFMKRLPFFVFITLFVLLNTPITAQSLLDRAAKRAAERLEQKTEERIDRKVDEQIDKSLDNVESSVQQDTETTARQERSTERASQRSAGNLLGRMGMSSTPVNLEDQYKFASSMRMNVKSYRKNGKLKSDGDMVTYINPSGEYLGYEFVSGEIDTPKSGQNKGLMVYDYKNNAMIILSDDGGKKTGIAYGLGNLTEWAASQEAQEGAVSEESEALYKHPNVKKTGRSKTILGYKCDEYEYTDENGRANMWITNDYKANTRDAFAGIFSLAFLAHGNMSGFLMESESLDLKSGEKTHMVVTDINLKANVTFNMSQYEITNIGSMNIATE